MRHAVSIIRSLNCMLMVLDGRRKGLADEASRDMTLIDPDPRLAPHESDYNNSLRGCTRVIADQITYQNLVREV